MTPTSECPLVSILILSWNARDYLRRCLASLYIPDDPEVATAWEAAGIPYSGDPVLGSEGDASACEVIVVDQQSVDRSAEMVEECFPQVRLIRQSPNLGFAGGNNLAIRQARGRFVLLLNSDTVCPLGLVDTLVRYAEEHPRAGLLAPKLLNPDGSLQYSCRRFPTLGAGLFRHSPLERLFPANRFTSDYLMRSWDHNEARQVDWLSGACLMARADMIREIGGLDEGYFMYFEDVDWAWRARSAGWEAHYLPSPAVIHAIGGSSDRRPKRMIVMHHESAYRYFVLHSPWGQTHLRRALLAAGLAARAALTLLRNEMIRTLAAVRSRTPGGDG